MALDPRKLSRDELVQLLNSTSLGECLTRGRLTSQMNRAGRRWHDGRHIRLLDYLRWLVQEVEKPAKTGLLPFVGPAGRLDGLGSRARPAPSNSWTLFFVFSLRFG